MRNSRVPTRIAILLATILAVAAGVCHLYMRFANNTPGEMYRIDGGIDYFYSAELFLFVFIPVWVFVFAPVWAVCFLAQRLLARRS
jgi:hypothetical protein